MEWRRSEWVSAIIREPCTGGGGDGRGRGYTCARRHQARAALHALVLTRSQGLLAALNAEEHSTEVAFLAANIIQHFFDEHIPQLARAIRSLANPKNFFDHWKCIKDKLIVELEIRVLSSIQLAAKMVIKENFDGTLVRKELQSRGKNYTLKSVYSSELRVFKTIDYRVPIISSINMVECIIEKIDVDIDEERKRLYFLAKQALNLILIRDPPRKLKHDCRQETCNLWNRTVACASVAVGYRIHCGVEDGEKTSRLENKISRFMNCDRADVVFMADHYMKIITM